eukprot:664058-Pelagomonas_calceolata.AAC.1
MEKSDQLSLSCSEGCVVHVKNAASQMITKGEVKARFRKFNVGARDVYRSCRVYGVSKQEKKNYAGRGNSPYIN